MMKLLNKLMIAAAVASLNFSVFALSITPSTQPQWSGSDPKNPNAADVSTIVGSPGLTLAYKDNVGGSEEGPLTASYETTFSNTANDPSDALIEFVGGTVIDTSKPTYLLVKDGDHDPRWYIFNLGNIGGVAWNGTDDLELTGFWPNGGAISHISIFGSPGQTVPDGGATAALLGLGVLGLAVARRKN